MSQILDWIRTNLFGSSSNNQQSEQPKQIEDVKNDDTKQGNTKQDDIKQEEKREITKWVPNDELYKKYNYFLSKINEIQKQKRNGEKMIERSKFLIKEYNRLKDRKDIDSRINASQTKQELLSLENKIIQGEEAIKKLEEADGSILDEWEEYLLKARNFLESNNINKNITINDILTSSVLLITAKKYLDGYVVSVNREDNLDIIAQLDLFFNIKRLKHTTKITDEEYENKKQQLIARIGASNIIADLETPHQLNVLGYNENTHTEQTINITDSNVQMVIAQPLVQAIVHNPNQEATVLAIEPINEDEENNITPIVREITNESNNNEEESTEQNNVQDG